MTVFEQIKNMNIEELASFLSNLEYEIEVGDFDSHYSDGKEFAEIVSYHNLCGNAYDYVRLLNTKIES